jgi:TolB protein
MVKMPLSIDTEHGTTTNVSAGSGPKISPAIFPSGEIAYVRRDEPSSGIFYVSGKQGPAGQLRSPSWSPDGGRLVYHRPVINLSNAPQRVWSRNADYQLMLTRVQTPSFHPSGQRFVGYAGGELTLVRMDAGESHSLLSEGKETYPGQWSATGDSIIFGFGGFFSFGRDRGAQVALIQEDGSGFRMLTSGANNNGFASLSPDGNRFVYRTIGPEGQGLRITNRQDNSVTTLTTEYDNFPVWSPRGDLTVFTRLYHDDYEIFSIHPDGSGLRQLTSSPGHDSHASWSPDGQSLAFTSARMGFKDEALNTDVGQPYGEIFVMRYDGSHIQQLTDNQREDGTPVWQPHPFTEHK